jgi:hypothetical protein
MNLQHEKLGYVLLARRLFFFQNKFNYKIRKNPRNIHEVQFILMLLQFVYTQT